MQSLTEEKVRECLIGCGLRRTLLDAQDNRLRRDTERALREARNVGIPLGVAAKLAGVSRSNAYARYLSQGGDDGSSNGNGPTQQPPVG